MSNKKISLSELETKLGDIDIPDEDLRQFFDANPSQARPFQPALSINTELVDVSIEEEPRVESGIVSGFINSIARFRRRKRFNRDRKAHPERRVLVSEGDSWFQFPFFLDDVIDQVLDCRQFNVLSVGAAGDTLKNMILENPEYLDHLDEVFDSVKGFVFSGGGNDILGDDDQGEPVLKRLVRNFDANLTPEQHLIDGEVDAQFKFIKNCYQTLIDDIRSEFPTLPIFIHGYGYVFPGNFDISDRRHPFYADEEQWIAGPLKAKNISDPKFQRNIVRHLLDRFYQMQTELVQANTHIHQIDVRETVAAVNEWNDEIHPNDEGFRKVGAEFIRVINSVI